MNATSLKEIKVELENLNTKELIELCLRLARYKKENKEFVAYLLFNAGDIEAYTAAIKENMKESFKEVNISNAYFAKKGLRKILRQSNRYIKYTASKQTEAEVLIHFCILLKASGIILERNKALNNIFIQQIKKINTAVKTLHEDIQYDFLKQLEQL